MTTPFVEELLDPPADIAQTAVRFVWHHGTQVASYADVGPVMLVSGEGAVVRDASGREYIDGTSIQGPTHIGHGRAEMADAIAAQVRRLEYGSLANGFSNVPAALLAQKLAGLTPTGLEVSYFCTSGAEAVETALKMARQYHARRGEPGRTKIIGRHGSYHGSTLGAQSASGVTSSRRTTGGPSSGAVPGFSHVVHPFCDHCELRLRYPSCQLACAEDLESEILREGPEGVAAFIAEPVATPQAVKVPPPEYWPRIRQICDRYGVLLIVDEVFTGFGRTGRMFGSEHWSLVPDIMTVSKGLTSGYLPLSAAIAQRAIADAFWGDEDIAFDNGGTYSGHPVSCAAALCNLEIVEREDLVGHAARGGGLLLQGLRDLSARAFVGAINGLGLLASMEIVNADGRPAPAVSRFIGEHMKERGVLIRTRPQAIYFYPPLVITDAQIAAILEALGSALDDAGRRFPG